MKKEKSRSFAIEVVKNVKEALEDYDRDEIRYAVTAIDNFVSNTSGQDNRHFSKSRKALLPLRNTLNGILDTETNRALSSALSKYETRIGEYLNNFVTEYKAAMKSESARATPKSSDDEIADAEEKWKNVGIKDRDIAMLEDHVKLLSQLPKKVDDGFEIVETSVLPAFKNSMVRMDIPLEKAGIDYDKLDGYYILKDQTLLAFNGGEIKTKEDRINYANLCINVMNDSGNDQYTIVSDFFLRGPGSANIVYAWIMDTRKFNRLYDAAGSFAVKEWSFPTVKQRLEEKESVNDTRSKLQKPKTVTKPKRRAVEPVAVPSKHRGPRTLEIM